MITRRGVLTVIATLATSLALLGAPLYTNGSGRESFLQVNGFNSLMLAVPVAIGILGLFSNRMKLFAGFLMLGWVVLGALTIGLYYIPIAACLLWPVKSRQAEGSVPTLR